MSNAADRIKVGVRLAPPGKATTPDQANSPERAAAPQEGTAPDAVSYDVSAWLTHGSALDAAGADALFLDLPGDGEHDPVVLVASLAAVTYRCLLVLADHAASDRTAHTLGVVSRGRVIQMREAETEDGAPAAVEQAIDGGDSLRWEETEVPAGRLAWRQALAAAAERGAHGVIVPTDPRLLDLLRNPDEEIDRRDLQLASG
jgi:hypothetical protein